MLFFLLAVADRLRSRWPSRRFRERLLHGATFIYQRNSKNFFSNAAMCFEVPLIRLLQSVNVRLQLALSFLDRTEFAV
jgi:hypothetical protein